MPLQPSLADLRAFVTVGELQSFAAAARELHLTQPALSRRISHLESLLAVRLLDRTTRSVELTRLGRRFHAEMRQLIGELERSVQHLHEAAELQAGDVSVGCVFSAVHHFLPEVIRDFHARYPQVMVRIVEEGADEVLESVKSGEADFAINYIGMHDQDLEFTSLLQESFVLACPPGHPLAAEPVVHWEALADFPYGLVSHASRNRVLIDQALATAGRRPRPACEVRHVSTLIDLVQSGLVVAVVPELTLPADQHAVVGIRLADPPITRMLGVVRRAGRSLSPAAQAFLDMLVLAGKAKTDAAASVSAALSVPAAG